MRLAGTCRFVGAMALALASWGADAFQLSVYIPLLPEGINPGYVSGGPISCNTTLGITYLPNVCSASVPAGTTVTLTRSTGSAFVFLGWSGAPCGVMTECTVVMDADIS